jgi:hypothetical protein
VPVEHHDDGTSDGMFDLRIGPAGAPAVAIEVVGAVDPGYAKTWSTGPGRGPEQTFGGTDWMLFLAEGTAGELLRKKLPALVRRLELAGWHHHGGDELLQHRMDDPLAEDLAARGVVAVYCIAESGSGTVHLGLLPQTGSSDPSGMSVPPWVSEFLIRSNTSDVLKKLARSLAAERHVFVHVDLRGAPFALWNYLAGPIERTPVSAPSLPDVVDQVWLTTGYVARGRSPQGLRWDGESWTTFTWPPRQDSELDEDAE